ncbi:MAG: polyprenol monophosphomannose synthase [Candidatus Nanopelagicaceae bacterium]|nr:polyprenol monophosphomannose synthase [Candidatus Nanopelagicaceae bacterium]
MKILVIIPTYNEVQSINSVIDGVLSLPFDLHILIVDDNSPDGTSKAVKELNYDRVQVLDRTEKSGLGAAYRAGFQGGLKDSTFTHFVTMDGDGSHRWQDLNRLIERAKNADVVMGTRWMPGGAIENWPKYRQFISRIGTSYARWALKMPLDDLTGGFRVYSVHLLRRIKIETITSDGYCFQIEMVRAAHAADGTFAQEPITFVEREHGKSKMSRRIVIEALTKVTRWAVESRVRNNADKLHYVK